jgi:hypothetical protein
MFPFVPSHLNRVELMILLPVIHNTIAIAHSFIWLSKVLVYPAHFPIWNNWHQIDAHRNTSKFLPHDLRDHGFMSKSRNLLIVFTTSPNFSPPSKPVHDAREKYPSLTSPIRSLPLPLPGPPYPALLHLLQHVILLQLESVHTNDRTHFQASKFAATQPNPKESIRTPPQSPQTSQNKSNLEKSQAQGFRCAECFPV